MTIKIVFAYFCPMKITRKNIIIALLSLLTIVLIYSISSQSSNISFTIELASDNNSAEGSFFSGFELHEDEQVANKIEVFSTFEYNNQPRQFQLISPLSQTYNVIWQPPNIS